MQSELIKIPKEEVKQAFLSEMFRAFDNVPKDYEIDEGYFNTTFGREFIYKMAFFRFDRRSPDKIEGSEIWIDGDVYNVRIYYR